MKKISLLFTTLLLLTSCSKSYKVNIEFSDTLEKDAKVYLTDYMSGDTLAIATANGKTCTLEGSLDKPFACNISWDGCNYPLFNIIVDEGETNVNLTESIKVSGPLNETRDACESERLNKIYNGDADYNSVYLDYYRKNKDNIIGQWAFASYLGSKHPDDAQINKLLKEAPDEYSQLKIIDKMKYLNHQAELTSEDKQYLDFEITNSKGETHKLSDYVGEDHFTIVYFFWPAVAEKNSKDLLPLNLSQESEHIQVVGISLYADEEQTKEAIARAEIKFPVLMSKQPTSQPAELYGLYRYSNYYVIIGGNGKILWRDYKLDEIMQKVLNK